MKYIIKIDDSLEYEEVHTDHEVLVGDYIMIGDGVITYYVNGRIHTDVGCMLECYIADKGIVANPKPPATIRKFLNRVA